MRLGTVASLLALGALTACGGGGSGSGAAGGGGAEVAREDGAVGTRKLDTAEGPGVDDATVDVTPVGDAGPGDGGPLDGDGPASGGGGNAGDGDGGAASGDELDGLGDLPSDAQGSDGASAMGWVLVEEAYPPGALLSAWAPGTGAVWFAGGQLGEPLVLSLADGEWTRHDPGFGQQAWWGHGWSDGRQVVVGDAGAIATTEDGSSWTDRTVAGLAGTTLYGVWGASHDDVWAVGGPFLQAGAGVEKVGHILLHWDGVEWLPVALPEVELPTGNGALFKVWGASADAVWVVGSSGLILHYDGVAWGREVVDGLGAPALFTVSGRGADDVWAVGGGAKSVLLHRDGSGWAPVELPAFAPQILQGIHAATSVRVSGAFGFTAALTGSGEWLLDDPVTTLQLHAILETPTAAYAVGGNIATLSADYDGTLIVMGAQPPPLPVD